VPPATAGVDLPGSLYDTLDSVYLWGDDPVAVNLLLWAVAQRANPEALWVVLRGAEELRSEDPVALEWVPRDRVRFARAEQMAPGTVLPTPALLSVIRSDEPQEKITLLIDFLSLPQALQEFLAELPAAGQRAAMVVEHAEEMASHYPLDAATASSFVRVFRNQGVKLMVSYHAAPRHDRFAFDHVYRVRRAESGHWRDATVTREQGTPGAPFEMGTAVPLERVEPFRTAAERVPG
jgi:hypothetical protein